MRIETNGTHKLPTGASNIVIVKVSGDAAGASLALGYADGENVVPYSTNDPVISGSQFRVESGGDAMYLIVTGGSGIRLNVIVKGLD